MKSPFVSVATGGLLCSAAFALQADFMHQSPRGSAPGHCCSRAKASEVRRASTAHMPYFSLTWSNPVPKLSFPQMNGDRSSPPSSLRRNLHAGGGGADARTALMERPISRVRLPAGLRVHVLSDLHTDYKDNLAWCGISLATRSADHVFQTLCCVSLSALGCVCSFISVSGPLSLYGRDTSPMHVIRETLVLGLRSIVHK